MNTKSKMHEKISAFVDGELCDSEVEVVMKELLTPEGRAAWDVYHHAGDIIRSDDMDIKLSPCFATRMAARLENEPTILAPAAAAEAATRQGRLRRIFVPAFSAAAVAAIAFVVTPPVLKVFNFGATEAVVASASQTVSHASVMPVTTSAASADRAAPLWASDLNQYMQAHQRLSPSFDSSVQYDATADVAGTLAK